MVNGTEVRLCAEVGLDELSPEDIISSLVYVWSWKEESSELKMGARLFVSARAEIGPPTRAIVAAILRVC